MIFCFCFFLFKKLILCWTLRAIQFDNTQDRRWTRDSLLAQIRDHSLSLQLHLKNEETKKLTRETKNVTSHILCHTGPYTQVHNNWCHIQALQIRRKLKIKNALNGYEIWNRLCYDVWACAYVCVCVAKKEIEATRKERERKRLAISANHL